MQQTKDVFSNTGFSLLSAMLQMSLYSVKVLSVSYQVKNSIFPLNSWIQGGSILMNIRFTGIILFFSLNIHEYTHTHTPSSPSSGNWLEYSIILKFYLAINYGNTSVPH